jgi:cytochrome c-type protein NapB
VPADVLPAVPYAAMDGKARGPNRAWTADLRTLVGPTPRITDAVVQSEAQRQTTLARRAARRAYNGAPPVIPHPVDANDVSTCYACHGEGLNIDGVIAPKISHQRYTNCTQCHAQAATPAPGNMPDFAVANTFTGLASPGRGARAYPGAPPQIPHHTSMREDCMSCHGVLGMQGLRSTHPWRANCTQCHTPSAALDQHRFADATPPPWSPPTPRGVP